MDFLSKHTLDPDNAIIGLSPNVELFSQKSCVYERTADCKRFRLPNGVTPIRQPVIIPVFQQRRQSFRRCGKILQIQPKIDEIDFFLLEFFSFWDFFFQNRLHQLVGLKKSHEDEPATHHVEEASTQSSEYLPGELVIFFNQQSNWIPSVGVFARVSEPQTDPKMVSIFLDAKETQAREVLVSDVLPFHPSMLEKLSTTASMQQLVHDVLDDFYEAQVEAIKERYEKNFFFFNYYFFINFFLLFFLVHINFLVKMEWMLICY